MLCCCVIERSLSLHAGVKSRKQRAGIVVVLLLVTVAVVVAAAHCIDQYQDSPLSSWFNSWPLDHWKPSTVSIFTDKMGRYSLQITSTFNISTKWKI